MKENQICTREYLPVCGFKIVESGISKYSTIKATYENKCTTCAEKGVEFYVEGSCDEYPKNATFCHPDAHMKEICTREFIPTCSLFDKTISCVNGPCSSNYSNKCIACTNQQVSYFLSGYCDIQKQYHE